jgi:hypothetical protein
MSIKVEHSGGWKPNTYLPYCVDGSSFKVPKRVNADLPTLPPVSKPKGVTEVKAKPNPTPLDKKITEANNKDLKSKNISTSTDK